MGIIAGNIIAAIPMIQTISKKEIEERESEDTMLATPDVIMPESDDIIISGIK
jgi:hypothetical protein